MTTEGGGWTIVFYPDGNPHGSTTIPYTASTPQLLAAATNAMMAYRDHALAIAPLRATFAMPDAWRTSTPFNVMETDVSTSASIDGAAPVAATLRFGSDSFNAYCGDPWVSAAYGRVCIIGTQAPYYSGFARAGGELCSDSSQAYSAAACTTDRRFSIAVR
jgi:hypothetical protein